MLRSFCLSALYLVAGSSSLVFGTTVASAQVTLEVKYAEGTKSVVQREQKSSQTLTLNGMNIDTKTSMTMMMTSSIGKRAADGTLKIEDKVDNLQSEISLPFGAVTFDSANPDKKAEIPMLEPVMDLFRALCRLPVTIEIDEKNKITSIKLPDGEFEKLPPGASDQLSPETMKKAREQANAFLPEDPVKPGDTWERASESNLGGGQTLSLRSKYEYVGTVEKDGAKLDKIKGKSFEVSLAVNGNPQMQVTKSDLKVVDSESVILFDRERGTIVSSTSKLQVAGPLTLVIGSMEFASSVDLTIEDTTTRQKK